MQTTKRIKTNVVQLSQLYKRPCSDWLDRFGNKEWIDAHLAFKKYYEQYEWLYDNSPYDLIGWEIENKLFNWDKFSHYVAKLCPEHLDPMKYNWKWHSCSVAIYCKDLIDSNISRFNYKHLWAVERYCPEKLALFK